MRQRGGELKKLQAAIEGGTVRKEERIASNSKEGVSHGNSREGGVKKTRGEKKQENERRKESKKMRSEIKIQRKSS